MRDQLREQGQLTLLRFDRRYGDSLAIPVDVLPLQGEGF